MRTSASRPAPNRPAGVETLSCSGIPSPAGAFATGFTDYGYELLASSESRLILDGALRLRSAAFVNLDLDRGPTPSGELFFPVSPSDPSRQVITAIVDEDQLSLAIGRNGQNVRLASQLIGWQIDLYGSREWLEKGADLSLFAGGGEEQYETADFPLW